MRSEMCLFFWDDTRLICQCIWTARPTDEGILACLAYIGGPRVSSCEETGKLADPCPSSISICKLHLLSSSWAPLQPVAVGHGRRGRCCRCYCMAVWNINATEPALRVPVLIKNRAGRESGGEEELGASPHRPVCNDFNLCPHHVSI